MDTVTYGISKKRVSHYYRIMHKVTVLHLTLYIRVLPGIISLIPPAPSLQPWSRDRRVVVESRLACSLSSGPLAKSSLRMSQSVPTQQSHEDEDINLGPLLVSKLQVSPSYMNQPPGHDSESRNSEFLHKTSRSYLMQAYTPLRLSRTRPRRI